MAGCASRTVRGVRGFARDGALDGGAAMNVPSRIGRYEILRRLGKGMTEVYLATDILDQRKIALKLAPTGGDATDRLIVEAERRGAAIQKELRGVDPRIVEVYECGEQDGWFYVAMEYVEGRSLADLLRAGHPIEPVRAAAIAIELRSEEHTSE